MPAEPEEILQVLVRIVAREMMLKADQVVIYNQRWLIPPDNRLYVSIGITGTRPYAVNRRYRAGTIVDTPTQTRQVLFQDQTINAQDILTLNIYSHGESARIRRNELILALASDYAEQQMEARGFSIGAVPVSDVDVSEGEGTDRLNRYAVTFNLLYAEGKTSPVEYFNQFPSGQTVLQP